ncbi:hypothetical protein ACFL50_04350, partial [Candidatus Latescibacterota bacterium]
EKLISEVEFYPDSTVASGLHTITIISKHGGKRDSLELFVEVIYPDYPLPSTPYPSQSFVSWIQEEYPEMGIIPRVKWIHYINYPINILPGQSLEQTWINQSWEMTVFNLGYYPYMKWCLLRKRGEIKPFFAAKRDNFENNIYYEIDINDFKK